MANGGSSTAQSGGPGPKPAGPVTDERGEQKKALASWWKNFKRSDKKATEQVPQGIFGVPLQTSIRYANVAISLYNDEGQSYIYGYVPIVVAKCGVFLKERATDVEGIFRLAGSEKRIKELKVAFDSPDRYGKGLDWNGYTVHDAANILRRYFNQLPEPIIPLDFYERFRNPLRDHQAQAVGSIEAQSPSVGDFDQAAAIRHYQNLITELPPLNRQLLLYILDLLAVFASKSDLNKMTTPNLAAIFQPGILSHPQHDMAPQEYRLSQDVLIFLIENQDSFLVGMTGTEADPETVREIQSGSPGRAPSTPTTPNRSKTVIGRTSSNASAGAESVRKWGNLRRNVSVSSKQSQRSQGGPTPVVGTINSPGTPTSGVHRSNTVPSRRGGSTTSPRFSSKEKVSDPPTPTPAVAAEAAEVTQAATPQAAPATSDSIQNTPEAAPVSTFPKSPEVTAATPEGAATPLAIVTSNGSSAATQTPKRDTTPLLASALSDSAERNHSSTPSTSGFLGIFNKSSPPGADGESRKPNKLQKKRVPGSSLSSAHSSSHSLGHDGTHEGQARSPIAAAFPAAVLTGEPVVAPSKPAEKSAENVSPTGAQATMAMPATPARNPTDTTLRPSVSPTHSYRSHTDTSDADMVGDDMPAADRGPEKEKKRRWRFSRAQNKLDTPSMPNAMYGSNKEQGTSKSTVGSSAGGQQRKSFQDTLVTPVSTEPSGGTPLASPRIQPVSTDPVFSDSERERKGPMSWIRGKIQEHRDKEAEKRSKTPERSRDRRGSRQELRHASDSQASTGKRSMEQNRMSMASGSPTRSTGQLGTIPDASAVAEAAEDGAPAPVVPLASTINNQIGSSTGHAA